jgi:exodeoxyribonuclease V beta subunit
VGQLSSNELDEHIQRYVLPGLERPALQNNVLQGMLSGFMDLVLQHDGRYWVLDYKSNLLVDYQAPHLSAAILAKRYEVQYVLYTLALHRLLQSRLPNYRYEQHMGGTVYLFLRGIDSPHAGVHTLRPAWALIDQLDSLFAKTAP